VGAMAEQSDRKIFTHTKNFRQKIAVFLNTNVMINFFQNLALF
jgi:hypothetical protein